MASSTGASDPSTPANQAQPPLSQQMSNSRSGSRSVSRRQSQIHPMNPPPLPLASPGGTATIPHHHGSPHAFPPLSPALMNYMPGSREFDTMGGGPTRLPRPLTAAELHLELEKEQEAVVNRLTRELSALRAHSASVASTASSSTSAALLDTSADTHSGSTHPTSSRRHRSSSAVSRNQSQGHARGSVSDAGRSGSVHHVSSPRYEEVAYWRAEMEDVKKENAMLRNRIMELERMLREKRDGEKVEKKESEAQGDIAREKEVGVEGSTSAGVSGAS